MGMYPPNMMGMNPNNINLNYDSSNPQGMPDMNNMNMHNMPNMNMQNFPNMNMQNMPGFNPMFQGQNNLSPNMNMQQMQDDEENQQLSD